MPEISIIMPAYNAEKNIAKCLDSILNQSFIDYEVIVIDDGSSDKTREICENYEKLDSRIKLVKQKNMGVGSVRKKALKLVRGEYTIHIDSDDFIADLMLEKMLNAAKKNNADIVYCDYFRFNESGLIGKVNHSYISDSKHFIEELLLHKVPGVLWNKLIKTSLYRNNNIDFEENINMWEDLLFVVKCLNFANKIVYLPEPLYYYFIHNKSLVNAVITEKRLMDQIHVVKELEVFYSGSSNFKKEIQYSKIYSKYGFLSSKSTYNPKLWGEFFPLKFREILFSCVSFKVKTISLLASLNLFMVINLLQNTYIFLKGLNH